MAFLDRPAPRTALLPLAAARLAAYWALIKDLQTGLLLFTAAAGYATGCCRNLQAPGILPMLGSLFLAVSGSTVLNMLLDRDIDARMVRTRGRPLPMGRVVPGEALLLGASLVAAGVGWAFGLDVLFGRVVLAGVLLDVLVYTVLLKRRTPFSVIIGGLAGGMPVLAGRAAAAGEIDTVGVLLALAVLAWIPTHIMTLGIKYGDDYRRAGVPVFPNVYGERVTRAVIAVTSVIAVGLALLAGLLVGASGGLLRGLGGAGLLLAGLVLLAAVRPGRQLNFVLYKGASLYMLASMILLIAGGF